MENEISANAEMIRAAIDAVFLPECHSLAEFPLHEPWGLSHGCEGGISSAESSSNDESASSYSLDLDIIRDMFDPKHYTNGKLTRELVVQRLALIDLFYTTNVNRYAQFGLYELADEILKFGSDNALANDARSFVKQPSTNHPINQRLFVGKYGFPGTHLVSIISKYLFFLLEVQGCATGFPIYDSMAKGLLPKVAQRLGIDRFASGTKINGANIKDIVKYVECINTVAQAIGIQPRVHDGKQLSQFAVFDFFLWRIGKVGNLSFSLLLTKSELPKYQTTLAAIKANRNNPRVLPALIAQLPGRFLLWYRIYQLF